MFQNSSLKGEVYSKIAVFFFFLPTKRLYKGRLLTEISASKELSNPMKSPSKVVPNSRSDCRHHGSLVTACLYCLYKKNQAIVDWTSPSKISTAIISNYWMTLFTIYKHFGDFVKCILRFCCKFSMKIMFHLPVNTDKAKFVAFLVFVCSTASFIAQISSCLETRRHLGSGRKTVNCQGYSELREPIKTRENCYSLIW